ncbi:MAG: TIGR04141 family sporadically distributed protein [Ignavibacteria bacterium]|nr:TIGR04141 family sporadically distributed protein [Ignavibacteria bacterium]
MKLTFYLFNNDVIDFNDALDQTKLSQEDGFAEINLVEDLPFEAKAYFQQNKKTKPKWLDFVGDYVKINVEEIFNVTNSFLLLLKCNNRIFAINNGFGFIAINRKKLEKRFGLQVVLNEIDPEKIKSVDARNIDTTTKQKRVFINRNSPLYEFDFDFDEDLVNIISGQPSDSALARKLIGSDSLNITADLKFPDLGEKCLQLLNSFNKDVYRQNFPFIDYLQTVKDEEIIADLEDILKTSIERRSKDKLSLAYPEIPDFELIEHIKIWKGHKKKFLDEVDIDHLYAFLDEINLDEDLDSINLQGVNENEQPVTKNYNLHDFIVFETTYSGLRYLLTFNQWFELAQNYVDDVNRQLQNIQEMKSGFLPPLKLGQREDNYNQFVVNGRTDIVLLDKQNYPVEGQSKVEVCDLLTKNREFICVKKYNSSSTLSHLFNQGYVSATLLCDEQKYREFIINECPDGFVSPTITKGEIESKNITFIYAIATKTSGPLAENLPFFSKVNLLKAYKNIQRMGFLVKTYKIEITN